MIYFAADVHLGLDAGNPAEREARFVTWLKSICKPDTTELWLLGDIWDFWYEYRDVIPREGVRVIAAIVNLLDAGVKVYYVPGNHDIWLYSFWQKLGVQVVQQPVERELAGKRFLLGHGDGLGGAKFGYRLMLSIFHSRVCQKLFSTLHPWLAYRFGTDWSNKNRRSHGGYHFRGADEPLYKFCMKRCAAASDAGTPIDFCLFGHFHDAVDMELPSDRTKGPKGQGDVMGVEPPSKQTGPRLVVLKDWIDGGSHFASFDGTNLKVF